MGQGEMQNVTVSVIIPVFNAEAYLRECLDVVCNQTLNDYEIICVDDCSADHSVAVLEEYRELYNHLIILRQPENMGAGPARNRGIQAARGEYIAFMDADDYYQHKDTLKNLYDQATEKDADICGGGMRYADTTKKQTNDQYCFSEEGWVEYRDYQQFYYYQRFLFRRSMLLDHEITFPDYLRFQDPPFFVRAMLAAERFYALTEVVYVYREDGNHVTWNLRKVNDLMQGQMDVMKLCMNNGLNCMLYALLKRVLENAYLHRILEASLSEGNVKVAEFYHFVLACTDHVLVRDMPGLDPSYAKAIDAWNRKTDMTFFHRSIELVDELCDPAPCVSVIIPVYNTDQYVASCIDSILAQTLTDIEIICIDDGSTDDSSIILDAYERKHDRIRVYHQANQGLSAARNAGMQHARGKYVYYMDSDDILQENALKVLYQRAEADDLDVLFFGAQSFFDENMTEEQRAKNKLPMEYKRIGEYPAAISGKKMFCMQNKNGAYYTPVCIQFAKTEFLRNENIAFYETILHEDNLYTIQLLFKAQRTGCIDEPFFQRRIRSHSIMTSTLTHRNTLGLYLTLTELMHEFNGLSLQTDEFNLLLQKMKNIVLNNLSWQWQKLPNVEKALFNASLTKEERMMFNVFVMPANDLRQKLITMKPGYASKGNSNVESELRMLKKEKAERWQELQNLRRQNGERYQQIQALMKEKDERYQELQQLRKQNSERYRQIQTLQKEKGERWQELQELRKQNAECKQELQSLRKQNGERYQTIQTLQKEKGERWQELQRLRKENAELLQEVRIQRKVKKVFRLK